MRDQHAGCVGTYLIEHDLFDFLLLSLPDNDTHSHKNGPFAQVVSLAQADKQIERLMHAAGGPDAFLEEHAVIVCSDHSQSQVEQEIDLFRAFDGFAVQPASKVRARAVESEIAVCPASRSAQVYVLDPERRAELVPRAERTLLALEGVDLVMRMTDHPDGEAVIRGMRGDETKELRFAPRGDLADLRGERWHVEGDLDLLALSAREGRIDSAVYPDALGRTWSALRCPTSGELLASAAPGFEFLDWGGAHHVGGGSHGALHANDSLGSLIWCGTGPPADSPRAVVAARRRADDRRALRRRAGLMRRPAAWLAVLALAAGLGGAGTASAQTAGTTVRAAGALVEPESYDRPPPGRSMTAREALAIAAARAEGARRARGRRVAYARAYLAAAAAGRSPGSCHRPGRSREREEIAQVLIRDRDRQRARGVDRRAGGVADGARLPRPVRALGQRALGLDRPVRAVRAPVRPPAAAAAAPRPGRAAGLLGLLRVLRRGGPRRVGAERLPAARLPARAHGRRRAATARAAAAACSSVPASCCSRSRSWPRSASR